MLSAPLMAGAEMKRNSAGILTRKLGKTGLELPVLSMGVMRSDNPTLVRACQDAGIVYFDTAYGYMGGKNEEMLGEVFKDVDRETIVIGTKVPPGERDRRTGELGPGTTKEDFLEKFETSLKRLHYFFWSISKTEPPLSIRLIKIRLKVFMKIIQIVLTLK